jgi:transposase
LVNRQLPNNFFNVQKFIFMQIVRTILQLLIRKTAERAIERELKISRTTVRKYKAAFDGCTYTYKELLALDDPRLSEVVYPSVSKQKPVKEDEPLSASDTRIEAFEAKRDYFLKELKRTGVTKQLLWKEYFSEHPDGYRYTQFCERLSRYQKVRDVSMRTHYTAADTVMIDFAGDKLHYVDPDTGERIECPVLVCVLPYSGYSYVEALPNASLPQLVKALNNCLLFFGGAPQSLLTDNMKQIVTKSCKYEPVFTQMILAWSQHNNIQLKTARVREPRDKAHVENEVKITYNRIYGPMRDKVYHSLATLNRSIMLHLKKHLKEPFQKKLHNRFDVFTSQEKPLLQSLPSEPYVMKYTTESKVQRNYHVFIGEDKHYYSVPYTLVGKKLNIVYDTDTVEIFDGFTRITQHRRSYKPYDYSTKPEHMPDAHKSYHEQMGWDRDHFLKQASKIGSCTRQYIERMIDSRAHKEHAYNGCIGLLRLVHQFSASRVEAACSLALSTESTAYRTIQNILANNRDTAARQTALVFSLPKHENIRGKKAYR